MNPKKQAEQGQALILALIILPILILGAQLVLKNGQRLQKKMDLQSDLDAVASTMIQERVRAYNAIAALNRAEDIIVNRMYVVAIQVTIIGACSAFGVGPCVKRAAALALKLPPFIKRVKKLNAVLARKQDDIKAHGDRVMDRHVQAYNLYHAGRAVLDGAKHGTSLWDNQKFLLYAMGAGPSTLQLHRSGAHDSSQEGRFRQESDVSKCETQIFKTLKTLKRKVGLKFEVPNQVDALYQNSTGTQKQKSLSSQQELARLQKRVQWDGQMYRFTSATAVQCTSFSGFFKSFGHGILGSLGFFKPYHLDASFYQGGNQIIFALGQRISDVSTFSETSAQLSDNPLSKLKNAIDVLVGDTLWTVAQLEILPSHTSEMNFSYRWVTPTLWNPLNQAFSEQNSKLVLRGIQRIPSKVMFAQSPAMEHQRR